MCGFEKRKSAKSDYLALLVGTLDLKKNEENDRKRKKYKDEKARVPNSMLGILAQKEIPRQAFSAYLGISFAFANATV